MHRIEYLTPTELYDQDRQEHPPMPADIQHQALVELRQLDERIKSIQADSSEAIELLEKRHSIRDGLICANLGLVCKAARIINTRYDWSSYEELVLEGNHKLTKIVDRGYNPSLGYAFSTYAIESLKRHLYRAVILRERPIAIPINGIKNIMAVKQARLDYYRDYGVWPEDGELAEILGININMVRRYRSQEQLMRPIYLDAPRRTRQGGKDMEGSHSCIGDQIADGKSVEMTASQGIDLPKDKEKARLILALLPEYLRRIVIEYYGFNGTAHMTGDQIAKKYGLKSRQQVFWLLKGARLRMGRTIEVIDSDKIRSTDGIWRGSLKNRVYISLGIIASDSRIKEALAKLKPDQRQTVDLVIGANGYCRFFSVQEVASEMKYSTNKVVKILFNIFSSNLTKTEGE